MKVYSIGKTWEDRPINVIEVDAAKYIADNQNKPRQEKAVANTT